jgi:hypothetical protein
MNKLNKSAMSIFIRTIPIFIMKDDGKDNKDNVEIFQAIEANIMCNNKYFDFIEKDGKYAYSEFFEEGTWPDEYYEDDELLEMYNGIRLKMISGGWCDSIVDLIHHIEININDEDESKIRRCLDLLKNEVNHDNHDNQVNQGFSTCYFFK